MGDIDKQNPSIIKTKVKKSVIPLLKGVPVLSNVTILEGDKKNVPPIKLVP